VDVRALVERELGDDSNVPERRPLRLCDFAALPWPTHKQEAAERAQASADARRYGDSLQAALRADIPWRERLNDPAVRAMVSDFNPKAARE